MLSNRKYIQVKKALKKLQSAYFYHPEFRDFIREIKLGVYREEYCIRFELSQELPENLHISDSYDGITIIKINPPMCTI